MILDHTEEPVVLVLGADTSLGRAAVEALAAKGARCAVAPGAVDGAAFHADASDNGTEPGLSAVHTTADHFGQLDAMVTVCMPDPDAPKALRGTADRLLDRGRAAAERMAETTDTFALVHHCFMPSAFADTPLDGELLVLQESINAVTKTLCVEYGRHGLRANTVLTGLFDCPEIESGIPAAIRDMNAPLGRWGTPADFAHAATWLALENDYVSGQHWVLDGGLTAST